jgi:nicotinamide riboside kinase
MKIAIIGKSGSGKSSLCSMLSNKVNIPILPENARKVLKYFTTQSQRRKQNIMTALQMFEEKKYDSFIIDRGLHDYIIFCQYYGLKNNLENYKLKNRYDKVFLMPNREFVKDDLRVEQNDNVAHGLQHKIESLYRETGHPLIPIPETTLDKQAEYVLDIVPSIRKYDN